MCPECGKPQKNCVCKKKKQKINSGDGIIRIRREIKGRRGKTVTTLSGFLLSHNDLMSLAAELKKNVVPVVRLKMI